MGSVDLRARRDRAKKRQHNRCFYCNITMDRASLPNEEINPKAITLEHLDDRFSVHRGKSPRGIRRVVAACYKCNQGRANERVAEFSRKEHQLEGDGRSGEN